MLSKFVRYNLAWVYVFITYQIFNNTLACPHCVNDMNATWFFILCIYLSSHRFLWSNQWYKDTTMLKQFFYQFSLFTRTSEFSCIKRIKTLRITRLGITCVSGECFNIKLIKGRCYRNLTFPVYFPYMHSNDLWAFYLKLLIYILFLPYSLILSLFSPLLFPSNSNKDDDAQNMLFLGMKQTNWRIKYIIC